MELNNELLTGFVRKLRILDREFRSTQKAAERVKKACQADLLEKEDQAWSRSYDQICQGYEQITRMRAEQAARRNEMLRMADKDREEIRERLKNCRMLLALADNAERIPAVSGTAGSSVLQETVELEALLAGKPDLVALACEANRLARAGKLREAQTARGRVEALSREAKRLLRAEIARLEMQLLDVDGAAYRSCVGTGIDPEVEGLLERHRQEQEQWMRNCAEELGKVAEEVRKELGELDGKRAQRVERITAAFMAEYPPYAFSELWTDARDAEPDWENFACAQTLPGRVCLAGAERDLGNLELCPETLAFLEEQYPFLILGNRLSIPWGLSLEAGENYEFCYEAKARDTAVQLARDVALRLIALLPPGKIGVTFADPVTLGESFAQFGRLAGGAAGGDSGKICSAPGDLERQLAALTEYITRINHQCLQGRYDNLAQYNRDSGREQEGYRVLMLMDYPAGMTEQSLKLLDRIQRQGPRCGVYTMIWRSEEQMKRLPDKLRPMVSSIREGARRLNISNAKAVFELPEKTGGTYVWRTKPTPSQQQLDRVFDRLWMGI